MRLACHATLVFCLAITGTLGRSQKRSISFEEVQTALQAQPLQASSNPDNLFSGANSQAVLTAVVRPAMHPFRPIRSHGFARSYLLLNGIHLGTALLDVEMTQHCMAEHKCTEGNPMMPSTQAAQIGVDLGSVTFAAAGSYWARKHNIRKWWIAPVVGIAAHAAGSATGFAHR